MELANRFQGLDLIERVTEELCMEVRDTVQKAVIKTIPKKKKCKKAECCHTVGPPWLSISDTAVCTCQAHTPNLFLLPPFHVPHFCSSF